MKRIKSIFKKIKNFKFFNNISEDKYYENLFIKNQSWNTKEPNTDEFNRWKIIEEFIKYVEINDKNIHILDLGCGRGWLTNLLSKYGIVIGIEPVKKVMKYAKKIYPNLIFLNGSTKDLLKNNYENRFNLVVSSEVIEHVPNNNKSNFVKDIYKLLNNKGYCIITTPRKEIQEEWINYTEINQPVEEWMTENELRILFEENNFKQIQLKRIAVKQKATNKMIDVYQVSLFKKTS